MTCRLFTAIASALALAALSTPADAVQEHAAAEAAPRALAAPAAFAARADELLLIFNGDRKPSASFSQAAMQRGKVSAEQLDERLRKFSAQARANFGRAEGIVEIVPVGPHQGIVVLNCKEEDVAVKLTLEPTEPHGMTGITAGPAVNLEAGLLRQAGSAPETRPPA